MKKVLFVALSLFLLVAFAFGASGDKKKKTIARGLYGKIYVTDDSLRADYRVRVVTDWRYADLDVFTTKDWRKQTKPGIWRLVDSSLQADYTICFVTDWRKADISIRYVRNESDAGPN